MKVSVDTEVSSWFSIVGVMLRDEQCAFRLMLMNLGCCVEGVRGFIPQRYEKSQLKVLYVTKQIVIAATMPMITEQRTQRADCQDQKHFYNELPVFSSSMDVNKAVA